MSEHPNAMRVRGAFEAWNAGRMDDLREAYAEDVVMHFAGNNAFSGTYRGRDAAMDALTRAWQGGGPHAELESLLASDHYVMTFFHATGERDGKPIDAILAQAYGINADGKIADIWFLANDQKQYDHFWS